jgi:hypothetical protein
VNTIHLAAAVVGDLSERREGHMLLRQEESYRYFLEEKSVLFVGRKRNWQCASDKLGPWDRDVLHVRLRAGAIPL